MKSRYTVEVVNISIATQLERIKKVPLEMPPAPINGCMATHNSLHGPLSITYGEMSGHQSCKSYMVALF